MHGADRAPVLRERVGGGATLRRDEIANAAAAEFRLAGGLGKRLIQARAAAGDRSRNHGEQLVARSGEVKLQLAVLVDGAERRDRRRALAVLAEAFGPELHPPFGEALEPVGIGHGDGDRFSAFAGGDRKGRAHRGRKFLRGLAGEKRRQYFAGAGADCLDIEAKRERGQQADVGKNGIAAADAGIVVENEAIVALQKIAQPVALADARGLGQADQMFRHLLAETRALQRIDDGDRLHQRLAGAAGFRDGDEARRLQRQALQKRLESDGIEIVEKVRARLVAQHAKSRHRVIGELRQRLAAEARAAGAEKDDVAGLGEFFHRLFQ